MKEKKEKFTRCPLCGNFFKTAKSECPRGCPWGQNCALICCPRCGYRLAEDSQTVNFLKKIFFPKKPRKEMDNE